MDILKKLYVSDITAVTGQFSDFSTYDKMPDLEKISRQQENQMQAQKLVTPQVAESNGGAFSMFDFGVISAMKNIFSK